MPDISLFESISQIDNPDSLPLDVVLMEIQSGRWQDIVLTIRNVKEKDERKKLKKMLPGFTFSGVFSSRKDNCIIEHSGKICMDIDNVQNLQELKDKLCEDRYVYSCFMSTGGNGLRVLFNIAGNKHRESYYGISAYLLTNYDVICDPTSMAPSRSFFVTWDPDLYINYKAKIFTDYPKEVKEKRINNFAFAKDDFNQILKQVQERRINLVENYNDWLKIGFAFADKFGESGRDYFHIVSSIGENYNKIRNDKQYDYCLRSKNSKIATISTFYFFAKEKGIQIISERTINIKKATINGKHAGLSKETIIKNLAEKGITDTKEIVESIFDGSANLDETDSIIEHLELFIKGGYNLRRNAISKYIEKDGRPMSVADINSIFISAKKILSKINYSDFERLLISDFVPEYDPLIEYFQSLGGVHDIPELAAEFANKEGFKTKDYNSPIIDTLSKTIINRDPLFTNYFLRKWLVSIVASAFRIHSPLIFVLVGQIQGTGKTEWFRRLLPADFSKRYYAESKLDAGKDDEILMCQKLVIMDDELSGKSKRENDRLKELTSKQWFSLREPYGKNNIDLQRIAVLCGTSNFKGILSDTSGNRRFIPIEVEDIDKKLFNSIDKTELFKECYRLLYEGFDWRIVSKDDRDFLKVKELEYEMLSVEGELIFKYYKKPKENEIYETMTSTEVKVELEFITHQKLSVAKIGGHFAKFEFVQKSVRNEDGASAKKWLLMKTNRSNEQNFQ